MGPLDHLRALPDGMACTVCEERVPNDRIRLLARRDDLSFLQLDCPVCGSSSLGFISAAAVAPEADRLAGGPSISPDDVLDVHAFLASWSGDLRSLVGGSAARAGRGTPRGERTAASPVERHA